MSHRHCFETHPNDWMEIPEELWQVFVAYMRSQSVVVGEKSGYFLYGYERRPAEKRSIGWFGDDCAGYVMCTVAALLQWQETEKCLAAIDAHLNFGTDM